MAGRFRDYPQAATKSSLPTHTPPVGPEPSYLSGLAAYQYVEISGSSLSVLNPTVPNGTAAAIVDAWNGFAIDTRSNKIVGPALSGHTDSSYNGVPMIDMSQNSPAFVELLTSNTAGEIDASPNTGRYTNGRPAGSHTYYMLQCIEANNDFVRWGCGAVSTSGQPKTDVDAYPTSGSGNIWRAENTYPDLPAVNTGMAIVKTSNEDILAFHDNNEVYKWRRATNDYLARSVEFSGIGFPDISPIESCTAWDSTRSRAYLLKGNQNTNSHTYDPTTGTFTAQTLSGAGAAGLSALAKGAGMFYDPVTDAYYVRGGLAGGGTIYRINASTFEVTTPTTSGGASIPATATISGSPENVYQKWLFSPTYRVAFYLPRYTANWWAMKLPSV